MVIATTHLKSLWHLRERAGAHEGQTNGEGCLEWWWFQNKADMAPWRKLLIEINTIHTKVHFLGSNKYTEESQGNGHDGG